jgi:predicted GH43/DUF377 family glycosyl hydrolase
MKKGAVKYRRLKYKRSDNKKIIHLFLVLVIIVLILVLVINGYYSYKKELKKAEGLYTVGIFGAINPDIIKFIDAKTFVSDGYIEAAIEMNIQNLKNFVFNFNGKNHSFYDDTLVLSMNFDKNSNILESYHRVKDNTMYENNGDYHKSLVFERQNNKDPVFTIGSPDKFDNKSIYDIQVMFINNNYRMFYSGGNGVTDGIGVAYSSDGVNWIRENNGNPVLSSGAVGKFDSKYIRKPTVVFDGTEYKMWYIGGNGNASLMVGFATSTDGITWLRQNNGDPILAGSSGKFDSSGIYRCSVVFDGAEYKMWYTGKNSSGSYNIGYATSANGINWNIQNNGNPIFIDLSSSFDSKGKIVSQVLYAENMINMFYIGLNSSNLTATQNFVHITSADGLNWTKHNKYEPVFKINPGKFDSGKIQTPSVIYNDNKYHMWYLGDDSGAEIIACPGDANGDLVVNNTDMVYLKTFDSGKNNCFDTNNWCNGADLNRNGYAGEGLDEIIISNNWLKTCDNKPLGNGYENLGYAVSTEDHFGKYSSSASFDGVIDYIEVFDNPSLQFTDEFSISTWIYLKEDKNATKLILAKYLDYFLTLTSVNKVTIGTVSSTSTWASLTSNRIVPLNQWTLITVVKNQTGFIIFINGIEDKRGSNSYFFGTTNVTPDITRVTPGKSLFIGRMYVDVNFTLLNYSGYVDELNMWNRTLTGDFIKELYYSNLKKYDYNKWVFYINQTKNPGEILDEGTYTMQGYLSDTTENEYETSSRIFTYPVQEESNPPITPPDNGDGNTDSSGSSGSIIPAGSSTGFWTTSYNINNLQLNNGYNIQLKARQRVMFNIEGNNYYYGVFRLTNNSAKINISVYPYQIDFNIGDEKTLNFNGVNTLLKLNNISGVYADMTIKSIPGEVQIPYNDIIVTSNKTNKPTNFIEIPIKQDNIWNYFYIIAGVLIFAIVIVIFFIVIEIKRKKNILKKNVDEKDKFMKVKITKTK